MGWQMCQHYCSHGGRCTLERGHEGLHDSSGECRWPDAESITRAEADAIMAKTEFGASFLETLQPFADMLEGLADLMDDDDNE
jgi:hypothetical protein